MLRVLNVEPDSYDAEALTILKSFAEVTGKALSRAELLNELGGYDVLVTRLDHRIDREVLERATSLKAVVTATTGLNHVDLECAKEHGIAVLSLKGENDFLRGVSATAELAFGLLIALWRNLPGAHQDAVSGQWRRDRFRGHELKGKTLGIIGCGRLGSKVAAYAQAFGMSVLGCDVKKGLSVQGVTWVELDELLKRSDAVTIHVDLNSGSANLMSRECLGKMKPEAILVNTSRGEVLDEAALLDFLKNGKIAGAALDVLRGENSAIADWPANDPLILHARTHGNLILTPHIGGATDESFKMTEVFMAKKLEGHARRNGWIKK